MQVYSKLCTGMFSSASLAFSFFNVSIAFEIKNQFKNINKYISAHDVLDLYVCKTIKLMSDKFTILVNFKSVEGYILLRGKLVGVNCLEKRGKLTFYCTEYMFLKRMPKGNFILEATNGFKMSFSCLRVVPLT